MQRETKPGKVQQHYYAIVDYNKCKVLAQKFKDKEEQENLTKKMEIRDSKRLEQHATMLTSMSKEEDELLNDLISEFTEEDIKTNCKECDNIKIEEKKSTLHREY